MPHSTLACARLASPRPPCRWIAGRRIAAAAVASLFVLAADQAPAGLDPNVEARVESLLSQLTDREKIALLAGDYFDTRPVPRLGIPSIKMTDGPLGARWSQATAFPAPILIGASFDPKLAEAIGRAMALEARARGRNMLLAPCVGIARHPLGGRNFESFGEDPFLNSVLAVGSIQGMRRERVLATVKHFAVNDQETQRTTIDTIVDERTLNEIHFPMFKAAVRSGAWAVMSSYNKVNGHWASENRALLTDVLKTAWGFAGIVVSDWQSTHDGLKAAQAGLDLEMPSADQFNESLLEHVRAGRLEMSAIDDKARRILRTIVGSGLIDAASDPLPPESTVSSPQHLALARQAAASGSVLLKNEGGVLPLVPSRIRSIALIGPGARHARIGAGGSSAVVPTRSRSVEEALREALTLAGPGGAAPRLESADGAPLSGDFMGIPRRDFEGGSLRAEYFASVDLTGPPAAAREEPTIAFDWVWTPPDAALAYDKWSARYSGTWIAPKDGVHEFVARASDGLRIWLDGVLAVDAWVSQPETVFRFSTRARRGQRVPIRVEERTFAHPKTIALGYAGDNPSTVGFDPNEELARAVNLARSADAAVVFVGLSSRHEGESVNRVSMNLPAEQDELVERILDVQPNATIVVNAGNPIAMPWSRRAKAILYAWYPGQEGSDAIADVLIGRVSPAGKLPVSFPKRWEDSAAYGAFPEDAPGSGRLTYKEGIYVGYRHFEKRGIEPLFPFGHGLSYGRFRYAGLRLRPARPSDGPDAVAIAEFSIANQGARAGAEAAQVYVAPISSSTDRPPQELKGLAKVYLRPGQATAARVLLTKDSFARWDLNAKAWRVDPGFYEIRVGSSSRDIRLRRRIQL